MAECDLCNTYESKARGWSNSVSSGGPFTVWLFSPAIELRGPVTKKKPVIAINAQLPNLSHLTKEQYQTGAMTIHIHGQSGLVIAIYPRGCFLYSDLSMGLSVIIKLLSPHIIPVVVSELSGALWLQLGPLLFLEQMLKNDSHLKQPPFCVVHKHTHVHTILPFLPPSLTLASN